MAWQGNLTYLRLLGQYTATITISTSTSTSTSTSIIISHVFVYEVCRDQIIDTCLQHIELAAISAGAAGAAGGGAGGGGTTTATAAAAAATTMTTTSGGRSGTGGSSGCSGSIGFSGDGCVDARRLQHIGKHPIVGICIIRYRWRRWWLL
jgi:hypothetical protein